MSDNRGNANTLSAYPSAELRIPAEYNIARSGISERGYWLIRDLLKKHKYVRNRLKAALINSGLSPKRSVGDA